MVSTWDWCTEINGLHSDSAPCPNCPSIWGLFLAKSWLLPGIFLNENIQGEYKGLTLYRILLTLLSWKEILWVHTVLIFPSRKEILWVQTLLIFPSWKEILWVHTAHISFPERNFVSAQCSYFLPGKKFCECAQCSHFLPAKNLSHSVLTQYAAHPLNHSPIPSHS